jgi:hypothetical protein
MKRKHRWYFRWPGEFYAWGPTEEEYGSEREVRAMLRESYGYKRLPRGMEIWIAVPFKMVKR